MKRLFTILSIVLYAVTTYAQLDFELYPIPAYGIGSADEDDFLAHSTIKNLSDQTIVIAWQRIENNIPQDWESYICSDVTCAPPDVSMGTFSLTAHDSTNLDCHFRPEGISGEGTVEIRFFLTDDPSQEIHATYFGNATPVSTVDLLKDKIKIFPNPATNYINIETSDWHSLEIYSIFGIHIKTFYNINRINMSSLKNGSYFLRIYNREQKLISINFFQKIKN